MSKTTGFFAMKCYNPVIFHGNRLVEGSFLKARKAQTSAYPITAIKEDSTPNPPPVSHILSEGMIMEQIGLPYAPSAVVMCNMSVTITKFHTACISAPLLMEFPLYAASENITPTSVPLITKSKTPAMRIKV